VAKLDTYTGLLLAYNIATSKETGAAISGYNYSVSSGGVVGAWFVGARYYFRDKFAVMGELGYGILSSKSAWKVRIVKIVFIGLGIASTIRFLHWNNASDKKYSRNLGKNYGIELVYIPLNNKKVSEFNLMI
jgi:hypothetical protein